jgi:hypothetical protein
METKLIKQKKYITTSIASKAFDKVANEPEFMCLVRKVNDKLKLSKKEHQTYKSYRKRLGELMRDIIYAPFYSIVSISDGKTTVRRYKITVCKTLQMVSINKNV